MLRLTIGIAAALITSGAAAQPFEITSSTIDGGGGTLSGSTYQLSGTIGQPDAGGPLTGATYELTGGFWAMGPGADCPVDLAPPFGLLDLADVLAFVAAFQANDPLADLDGNGLFDLADVLGFSTQFLQGCP